MARASRCSVSKTERKSVPRTSSRVVDRVEVIDGGHHQALEDHHRPSQTRIHFLEQPVEGQRKEDRHRPGEQIAEDAETEKHLMGDVVVGGRGWVIGHEPPVGNVDEANGAVRSVR
jgi:hypothetical protein